jgi:hypothetical protein
MAYRVCDVLTLGGGGVGRCDGGHWEDSLRECLALVAKQMKTRPHHIRYAAVRTLWVPPFFAVFLSFVLLSRGDATVEDFLWGMSGAVVLTAFLFFCFLREAQREKPLSKKAPHDDKT